MSEDWDDEGSPGQKDELAREWNFRREQHYNVAVGFMAATTADLLA